MPNEIELKVAVADHAAVLAALREAGAEPLGSLLQTDRFFDLPGRHLRQADSALRIRTLEPAGSIPAGRDLRAEVTFKGPRQPNASGLKVRGEVQTRIDDAAALLAIFSACGLRPMLTVQKRRTSFRLGGCAVELDELPALGCFVEIEGPDEQAIAAVRQRLGLAGEPITRSYVAMVDARFGGLADGAEVTFARLPPGPG